MLRFFLSDKWAVRLSVNRWEQCWRGPICIVNFVVIKWIKTNKSILDVTFKIQKLFLLELEGILFSFFLASPQKPQSIQHFSSTKGTFFSIREEKKRKDTRKLSDRLSKRFHHNSVVYCPRFRCQEPEDFRRIIWKSIYSYFDILKGRARLGRKKKIFLSKLRASSLTKETKTFMWLSLKMSGFLLPHKSEL